MCTFQFSDLNSLSVFSHLDVCSWSTMSYQHARQSRLLYKHSVRPWIRNYTCLYKQTQLSMCTKPVLPFVSKTLMATGNGRPFLSMLQIKLSFERGVTMVSKKGKRKTCKAVAKRFIRTGKGKLKRWRCGYHHNQTKKSSRRRRFLRKPTYASKTQLKTLNKMLNGW